MTDRAGFPLFRLLVVTGAIFASVSSEFTPTGILPEMADDLRIPESRVGLLVTVFALTVVVTAVPMTAATRRVSRKWLMAATLTGLALTNAVCAIAPDFAVLAAARVFGGICHGLFWAVTGPYAALLVRPEQLARALSVTNLGGTLAFIFGVPLSTAIGAALGWRASFATVAVAVFGFAVLVAALLPPVDHRVPLRTGEVAIAARRDPSLPGLVIVAVTVLVFVTGQNVFYTYIAPWLIGPGGIDRLQVSGMLFAYGVAGVVGIVIVALVGDRVPTAALVGVVTGVGASVVLLALFGRGTLPVLIGLALWSAAFAGWPALVNARMLRAASTRIRDLASATLTVAFNVAIGGGALIGSAALDGIGVAALPWIQVVFCAATLVVILVGVRARGTPSPRTPARTPRLP